MNYTKHEFKSGEKLYAQQLNEMDEQIHENTEAIEKQKKIIKELPILEETYVDTADKLTLVVNIDELESNILYKASYDPHKIVIVKYILVCSDGSKKTVIAAENAFNIVQITRDDTQGFISLVFDNVVYKVSYGDKSTADVVTVEKLYNQNYLGITNSIEFVPTGDYQPVPKKYVDDECRKLSAEIADLKENGTGSGVTTEMSQSLWAIMQKTAFTEPLTDEELNAFKTAWGIGGTGGEVEPDEPIEPDVPTTYSITRTFTNCTSNSTSESIMVGESYTETITANEGYVLGGITVTMGGIDVTSTVYADGVINIASVNGDVTIVATAVVAEVTESWETGVAYDLTGRTTEGTKINEFTGVEEISDASIVTDYLYCAGAEYLYYSSGTANVIFYDVNKNYISYYYKNIHPAFVEIPANAVYCRLTCATKYWSGTVTPMIKGADNCTLGEQTPEWLVGHLVQNTGNIEEHNGYRYAYVPVAGASALECESVGQFPTVALCDVNKNIIISKGSVVLPIDLTQLPYRAAAYFAICMSVNNYNSAQIVLK